MAALLLRGDAALVALMALLSIKMVFLCVMFPASRTRMVADFAAAGSFSWRFFRLEIF
jgi:hypothetical protein